MTNTPNQTNTSSTLNQTGTHRSNQWSASSSPLYNTNIEEVRSNLAKLDDYVIFGLIEDKPIFVSSGDKRKAIAMFEQCSDEILPEAATRR